MKIIFTLSRAGILILCFFTGIQVYSQLNYLTTVPPYNGGNGSSMVAFNIKAHVPIRIKEMYCTFSAATNQTTIIWYKTDSINGSPSVSTASGWIQAHSFTHTPNPIGNGTVALISDTSLNILIPAGATYGFAISGASIRYTGSGTTSVSPWIIGDSNLYINMEGNVGWGGTLTSPINYRQFNGKIGYELAYQPTDIAIESLVSPSDSLCSGDQPVQVMIKNNGSNPLQQLQLEWKVNGVPQPTYQWSGNLSPNGTAQVNVGTYPFLTGTTYNVKVNVANPNNLPDPLNTNDTILRENIFVKPSPTAIPTALQVDICQGDTAQLSFNLTGTAPWSITIKDGTTYIPFTQITSSNFTAKIVTPSTRTYTLESVSDATGCAISPGTLINVSVFPAPPASVSTPGGTAACAGDSVMLMGSVGLNFNYVWSKDGVTIPGQTSYLLAAKEPGSYTVKVTSPIGCSNTSAPLQVYIHPAPAVNLGNDTAVLPGQTVILNAGSGFNSYLWSTGATTQTINASSATVAVINYWVQVTDNNGCKGDDTIKINFTNHPGIDKYNESKEILLQPNPSTGLVELILELEHNESKQLAIFSSKGQQVFSTNLPASNSYVSSTVLDLRHLPEGMYMIRLTGSNFTRSLKLAIVK